MEGISTPALIVHLEKLSRNCERMRKNAAQANIILRPHIKTHKTIEGAMYQLYGEKNARTDGRITVSTLQEAQFFADSKKFSDIMYAVPIIGSKMEHAASLHNQIMFSILVDSHAAIDQLENFCLKNPSRVQKWNVLLKVDSGYHRVGIDPENISSLEIAKRLNSSPHIFFRGIYSHSGNSYSSVGSENIIKVAEEERIICVQFASKLKDMGIVCEIIAIGSTPACSLNSNWEGITEIHPGNYIFYDRFQASIGSCSEDDVAVSVCASVIGHYPGRNTMVIDAGSLALSKDAGPKLEKISWGSIRGSPHLRISSLSQECAILQSDEDIRFDDYPIGSRVMIVPNHSCLTAACFPKYYVEDKGIIIEEWKTCPRGW